MLSLGGGVLCDQDGEDDGSRESSGPADDVNDDEDQHDDHDEVRLIVHYSGSVFCLETEE